MQRSVEHGFTAAIVARAPSEVLSEAVDSRVLYAAYEMVPLVNALDRIPVATPTERRRLAVALAWATALATVASFGHPSRIGSASSSA